MTADAILAYCHAAQPRWLELLEALVNTDSGSRDLDGLALMAQQIQPRWEALGFHTELTSTDTGPQLVSRWACRRPDAPTLLWIGHTDTVFEQGTVRERPFTVKDGRAYGPGVADMKGGLVSMLGAVEALREVGGLDNMNLVVVNNCDEEIASINSRSLIEALSHEAEAAFVFEPGRPDGTVVNARKGGQGHTLQVEGVAAHAGVNPQDGASAIEALSHKITALHQLNDYGAGLTVNVGVVRGGSRANVVAEHATAKIDVRAPTMELAERVKVDIQAIAQREDVSGTKAKVTLDSERGPMAPTEASDRLFALFQEAAQALGFDLAATATGGGSDGNFTAAQGVPTLDGLGPVGGGYHSADEFLEIASLPLRAAMVAEAAGRFVERHEDEKEA